MRQQVVGFCELYMLVMGSWSVMGGSTLAQLREREQGEAARTATTISDAMPDQGFGRQIMGLARCNKDFRRLLEVVHIGSGELAVGKWLGKPRSVVHNWLNRAFTHC